VSCGTLSVKISQTHPLGRLIDNGRKLFPSLSHLGRLAKACGLFVRASRKIHPGDLLAALLSSIAFGEASARAIGLQLGICSDISVSRQAVWQRLRLPAITAFVEGVIQWVMVQSLTQPGALPELGDALRRTGSVIRRVLVGDASTFTLHPSLAGVFPGSKNGRAVPKAHLKLQLIVDLLTGGWVHFSLDAYGRSDAKAAFDFMPYLAAGDLLIRDLGYACMESFQAIIQARAFFISRLKARVYVLDPEGNRLALRRTLRRLAPRPGDIARVPVLMTESHQVPCYMVAVRVPLEVADERRRKLRVKHKEQGFNPPSARYLELQDWTILVTNLEEADVSNEQIVKWYLMRWRIELIFKACKSHTGMLKIAGHKTNEHHAKAVVLTWVLAMILLAHRGAFAMVHLVRSTLCPPGAEPQWDCEVCRLSLFKSIRRLILAMGMQIELAGSGYDLGEHYRRMARAFHKHNQTEKRKKRPSLPEILDSLLFSGA
jgi:hypothetical protein